MVGLQTYVEQARGRGGELLVVKGGGQRWRGEGFGYRGGKREAVSVEVGMDEDVGWCD